MASILVVEDNHDLRATIAAVLADAGYEVRTAGHGLDALRMLAAWRPHLILLDLMLPVMHGLTLCRYLNRSPDLQAIPLVIMSGTLNKPMLDDCLYQAFLDKPFDLDQVVALVQALLGNADGLAHPHHGAGATIHRQAARLHRPERPSAAGPDA